MVQYAQEGSPNRLIFNTEDYAVSVLILYLKEVNVLELDKNKAIFRAFSAAFSVIYGRHVTLAEESKDA